MFNVPCGKLRSVLSEANCAFWNSINFISQTNTTPPDNYYNITFFNQTSTVYIHLSHLHNNTLRLLFVTIRTSLLWDPQISRLCNPQKQIAKDCKFVILSPSAISLEYVCPNFKKNRSNLIKNSFILNMILFLNPWHCDKSQIAAICRMEDSNIFLAPFPMNDHILLWPNGKTVHIYVII